MCALADESDCNPDYEEYYVIQYVNSNGYLYGNGKFQDYIDLLTVRDKMNGVTAEDRLGGSCRWALNHVAFDEDPTLFNIINQYGNYLMVNSTFQSAYTNAAAVTV